MKVYESDHPALFQPYHRAGFCDECGSEGLLTRVLTFAVRKAPTKYLCGLCFCQAPPTGLVNARGGQSFGRAVRAADLNYVSTYNPTNAFNGGKNFQ